MSEKDLELEEMMDIVTLEDEDGNAVDFELAAEIAYEGKQYVVLLPMEEDDDGLVILEYMEDADEEGDLYLDVEDEAVLDAVFEQFKEQYGDQYNFAE